MHISYYDSTNGDLKYATNRDVTPGTGNCQSTDFDCEPVDSAGDVGRYTSIVIDSSYNVHISYYDSTNGDLKYATNRDVTPGTGNCQSTNFDCEPVDSTGDVGWNTSIAIDSSDNVHISYRDTTNGDLKYAVLDSDEDGIPDIYDNCPFSLPVRKIPGGTSYSTLQDAYDDAVDFDIVQSQAETLTGDLFVDINKSVTLKSGFDCDYNHPPDGKTVLNGDMIISNGTLTVESGTFEIQ